MIRGLIVSVAVVVAAGHGGGDEPPVPDNVLVLTGDNFGDHVGGKYPAFVEFYAPWCGHCKNLAPEWAKLADTFKPSDGVVIAKVDAEANRDLATEYGVKGYPTIKWFPAGSKSGEDYTAVRSAEDLIHFVNDKLGTRKQLKGIPSAVVPLNPSTFDKAVGDPAKHKLVEFYAPWCGHCKHLAPIYEKVAEAFEGEPNVIIAKVDADKHRDLGERFGVTGFPSLKYFPPGDGVSAPEDLVEDYTGGREGQNFVDFINEKAGTHRTLDGGLLPTAGRLEEFEAITRDFLSASDKSAAIEEAKAFANGLAADVKAKAENYIKVMQRIAEKGKDYVSKELARLDGLINSESTSKMKKLEFQLRRNVLSAFQPGS